MANMTQDNHCKHHRTPHFIKVNVSVTPSSIDGEYDIHCHPDPVKVHHLSVINFQLCPETPEDVVFTPKIIKCPADWHQLSDPTVSTDGKMLTLSDIHSKHGGVEVFLHVIGKHRKEIKFDPQIINEPQTVNEPPQQ
jgi:hypothetical protein